MWHQTFPRSQAASLGFPLSVINLRSAQHQTPLLQTLLQLRQAAVSGESYVMPEGQDTAETLLRPGHLLGGWHKWLMSPSSRRGLWREKPRDRPSAEKYLHQAATASSRGPGALLLQHRAISSSAFAHVPNLKSRKLCRTRTPPAKKQALGSDPAASCPALPGDSILQGLGYPGAKHWLEGTYCASRAVPAHKTHTKHSLTSHITQPQPSPHPTHTQIAQVPLQGTFSTGPYRVKLHSLKNSILTPRMGAEGKHASPQSHTPAFGQYLT